MGSWFASSSITYLLCTIIISVAGQTGTSDLESECGILMKLESLETRIHEQETNLRDQISSILEQGALITKLKSDMIDKDNRIGDLEADVDEKSTQISGLEAGVANKDNRIGDLETGMADKDTRISDLETGLTDKGNRISDLEAGMADKDNRISDLETGMTDKNNRISDLETGMADKDNRISDLETGMTDKHNRISDLEADMTDNDNRISDLEAGMTDKHNRISDLDSRLTEEEVRIDELQTALSEQETEIANLILRPTESEQAVGFTARFPQSSQTAPDQMAFKIVLTNEGGAFNNDTGVFTCPVAGLYYFNVALLKFYNYEGATACDIEKNGVDLVRALIRPGHNPKIGHYSAVNGVYARLAENDTVKLGNCHTPIATVFHDYSSFSGFLVTPDG